MPDDISQDLQDALTTLQGGAVAVREENSQRTDVAVREAAQDLPSVQPTRRKARDQGTSLQVEDAAQEDAEDTTTEERQVTATASEVPQKALERAPVTWKGPAKKEWEALTSTVKQEILRRERQIDAALSQTADQRKYAESMFNAIAPYEIHLRADGVNHVQAVDYLMKVSHVLRTGTPQARAKILANMFFDHGVQLDILDEYITQGLEGTTGQVSRADPVMQVLDQKLAPFASFMQEMQQARQVSTQRAAQGAAQTINELLDDPDIGDLVDDVREDMADLLELASKRGQILPLRDAAVRAIMAHTEHSVVYNQRQLAKQAQQHTDKAAQSRRAGASLQNQGALPAGKDDDEDDGSVLSALNMSIRELSQRR